MPNIFGLILTCVIVVIVFSLLLFLIKRYKKCPSDKVMVIYGKVGSNKDGSTRSAKCIHGGAAFIWPVIQSYEFLDLTPMSISVDLENALSRQNIRINVPSRFTVGVSTEPGVMQNAAERLLGLKLQEIQELAKDIIFGQLRSISAEKSTCPGVSSKVRVRFGMVMIAGSVKMVMPRCRSIVLVSRNASPWSTRPSLRTLPVAYSNASDSVVLPASTCARMPVTIRFMGSSHCRATAEAAAAYQYAKALTSIDVRAWW